MRALRRINIALWVACAFTATGCFETDFPTTCADDPSTCDNADSSTVDSSADDVIGEETPDEGVDTEADSGDDTGESPDMGTDSGSDSTLADSGADSKPADSGMDTIVVDSGADTKDAAIDSGSDTGPVCTANAYSCSGNDLRQCKTDGSGYTTVVTCPSGTCNAGLARCTYCTPGTLSCSSTQPTKCNALGSAYTNNGAACVAPQTCGGGGTTGVCGCTPKATSTVCSGKECGSVDNGCGMPVSCGTCTAPRTCGGGGTANKCGGCAGTLPGPTMVNVGTYCIDSTEVTQSQYAAFVSAKGSDLSGQPATCSSNTTYAPDTAAGCSTTANKPANCMDWCDAYMYCKWAGKRLCGHIGGGSNAYLDHADATKDQWFAACRSPSGNTFPYGNSYISGFCYTPGDSAATAVDIKSYPSCTGTSAPYTSIFDMSGNVSEWEDSCGNISGTWYCHTRGGNFTDAASTSVQCDDASVWPMDLQTKWLGFRCCAD